MGKHLRGSQFVSTVSCISLRGEGLSHAGSAFIFVVALFLVSGLGGVAYAANSTTAGVVTARATDATSILVKMPYSGDDNGNNTYTVQWKLCTDGAYPAPNVINGVHSASPYVTTVPGLTPNTCYTIKATYVDADTVSGTNPQEIKITSSWDTTLLHNRNRFMTSTKWDAEGGWGLPGTKYGQFACETCHTNSRANSNIKQILSPIIAPSGTFPGSSVVFQSAKDGTSDFGNDLGGHTSSNKICEVCHSITDFHRYDTNADPDGAGPLGPQITLEHNNNTDCTICHKHNAGFNIVGGTCTTCHGDPPPPLAGQGGTSGTPTGSTTAGTHSFHATSISAPYSKNYPCETCHNGSAGSGATHNNNIITMSFNIFGGAYTSGTYDGQTTANYQGSVPAPGPGSGAKTCSNIYCHGSTMDVAGDKNGGTNTTPSWDNSLPNYVYCGTCHGYFFPPPTRGSHTFHSGPGPTGRGLSCNDCHYGFTPTVVPSGLATHVNNQADFAFDPSKWFSYIGLSATYNGTLTMLDAYGNCSNLYCHSNVQPDGGTGAYTGVSVQWGAAGPLACSTASCHGGDTDPNKIATGSHTKHVTTSTYNYGCATCHNAAGHGTTKHADYAVDVTTGSYTGTPVPGDAYGSCSTAYCHSDGKSNYRSATWGGSTTGCDFCHDNPPATGAHIMHANTASAYGSTAVSSTAGDYDFGCGNCHPTNISSHGNGTVDISLNPADGGPLKSKNVSPSVTGSGGTTQCNGVYCHSDGKATPTFVQTPQWNTTFAAVGGDLCAKCHQNSPAGSQHSAHVVGIHYYNIYTGTTGLATAGNTIASSHGNGTSSRTINCNACHASTVDPVKYRNKYNTVCNSCHNGDADTTAMVSADLTKTKHVNGSPDITFGNFSMKSRAQIRDNIETVPELGNNWNRASTYKDPASPYDTSESALNSASYDTGDKGCNSVACHNGYRVKWTDSVSCYSCHRALP